MSKNKKLPQAINMPKSIKEPRSAVTQSRLFKWRTQHSDLQHTSWGWCCIEVEQLFNSVIVKLHDFETMEVKEMIGKNMLHTYSPEVIIKAAQKRLKELCNHSLLPEDLSESELTAISLNNKQRIWGYLMRGTFYLLWWDPEHEIYPTKKRNT